MSYEHVNISAVTLECVFVYLYFKMFVFFPLIYPVRKSNPFLS